MGKLTINEVIDHGVEMGLDRHEAGERFIKIEIVNAAKILDMKLPKDVILPTNHIIQLGDFVMVCSTADNKHYGVTIHTKMADKIHTKAILLIPEKYPRIYIRCQFQKTCPHRNIITKTEIENEVSYDYCMKTPRVAHNCETIEMTENIRNIINENDGLKNIKVFKTHTERYIYTAEILVKLGYYMKIEKKMGAKVPKKSNTPVKHSKPKDYTYFSAIRYIDSIKTDITRTSSPKCKHERREHIRTLKNGRKIRVKKCIINKDKDSKIYKI